MVEPYDIIVRHMFPWSPDMAKPKYVGSAACQTHTRLSSANDRTQAYKYSSSLGPLTLRLNTWLIPSMMPDLCSLKLSM
jgi:hypothetical protein